MSLKDLSNIFSFGFGELLVLISGFFFAYRNISRRFHSKLLNDQEITMLMFFFGMIMLMIVSFITGEKFVIPGLNIQWIGMLIIGGIIMIANLFISNYGFANVPLVLGNNLLNLEAVFGIIFGFFLYGEVTTVRELVGGLLIVYSVIQMSRLKE